MANISNADQVNQYYKHLPERIILVRHGESTTNTDEKIYGIKVDHEIPLSSNSIEQAKQAGSKILDVASEHGKSQNWKAYFYVSPSECTRSTFREIGQAFPTSRVNGVREECRIREQDFENFQDYVKMEDLKKIRDRYGRFFYRFPEGESGAYVYDRVAIFQVFLETLWWDKYMKGLSHDATDELNLVMVSHGLAVRIFLMKWFKWTVEQFESLKSPKNCEFRVMELGTSGEYCLAIQQDYETLEGWGLSPEMIKDQKLRAYANYGSPKLNEKNPSYLGTFFELADSDDHQSAEECGKN